MLATKGRTASPVVPLAALFKTRIGAFGSVSSTSHSACWQVYDRTAAGRLVGLDYFGARYYSGAQGRFTSPDEPLIDQSPYDPQSWNLYSYVRNNPLRYTDPTGRVCKQLKNGNFEGDCSSPGDEKVTQGNVPQSATVGVGRQQAALFMLAGLGASLSSPYQWATVASGAVKVQQVFLLRFRLPLCNVRQEIAARRVWRWQYFRVLSGVLVESSKCWKKLGALFISKFKALKAHTNVIANIIRQGDTIILEGAHLQGSGAGQFGGRELLKEVRAAKQFGREQGAKEVVIQGGTRTSGANPSHNPPPIRIRVQ